MELAWQIFLLQVWCARIRLTTVVRCVSPQLRHLNPSPIALGSFVVGSLIFSVSPSDQIGSAERPLGIAKSRSPRRGTQQRAGGEQIQGRAVGTCSDKAARSSRLLSESHKLEDSELQGRKAYV